MNKPKISIAMTCYNQGHFISDAIKSIVNQTIDKWELNIVDDKSTDNSLEEIKKLIRKFNIENKVNIIQHQKNKGYGPSLHDAIMAANAPLVGIIDSDDALSRTSVFERCINAHNENQNVVLTYSNYIECDKKLNQKSIFKTRQLEKHESYMTAGVRVSHFKVLKKEAYLKTDGINPKLRQTVDKDLVLKLEETGDFLHINKSLYFYRHHSNNLSRSIHKKSRQYRKFVSKMRTQIYEDAKQRRGIK